MPLAPRRWRQLRAQGGVRGKTPWSRVRWARGGGTSAASLAIQALSREQVLRAYTQGSACAEFSEHEKGKLAAGCLADVAVPSPDVLDDTVPLQALLGTSSLGRRA